MARTTGSTAEATQRRILAAAQELFAERGYAGTSIRDIAERLSMTKAALYYHFPGKLDVLAALVEPWLRELDEIAGWAEHQRPLNREEALRRMIAFLAAPNPTFAILAGDPSASHDTAERLDIRARVERLERALAAGDPRELLAVRCALGAVRGGILGTRLRREAPFSDADLEAVLRAGLAAWDAARGAPAAAAPPASGSGVAGG
jgi:AcrR family transcriptional regulator